MRALTRTLEFTLPMMRGRDVLDLQRQLRALDYGEVRQPDGLFGPATKRAVEAFQKAHDLKVDGIVGPVMAGVLLKLSRAADTAGEDRNDLLLVEIPRLMQPHRRFAGGCEWRLTADGVAIDGEAPRYTEGAPTTVTRVWQEYGAAINRWSQGLPVPVELIVATICTESGGRPEARREEPGWQSDARTPDRVSTGLTQTLISTAQWILKLPEIDGEWLRDPSNSIRAGAAYIAYQAPRTLLDPPVVACAYNAGGVKENDATENRWRMVQYPIGTPHHADRFVLWFNDCVRLFQNLPEGVPPIPELSFHNLVPRALANAA